MESLVLYHPGSQDWKDCTEMLKEMRKMILDDRPLEAKKTDVWPFGVFEVNEGSKKGIIEVLKAIQEWSSLSEEAWSSKVCIIEGDWLTLSNLHGALHDCVDDVNTMEHVEYPEELSAHFHFALQALHLFVRVTPTIC